MLLPPCSTPGVRPFCAGNRSRHRTKLWPDMTRVQPRIAVVVPCYNASETLGQTLESVTQQDVPVEIVVIDDGSTDASADIARRFSPWARVIEGPNRGVSNARNRGIAETTAEWLVFLDADDLLKPGTLRRRLAP